MGIASTLKGALLFEARMWKRIALWYWMLLPKRVRGFLLYNVLFFVVLAAIYVPYNIFWIQMTQFQLLKWLLTAAVFGSIANIALAPWIRFINRWLAARGYLRGPKPAPPRFCPSCGVRWEGFDRCLYCKEFGL